LFLLILRIWGLGDSQHELQKFWVLTGRYWYGRLLEQERKVMMKNLRIYDILTEDGKTLAEITLSMQEDFDWADVFDKLYDFTTENIQSYSYEEITVTE
jgi:hypothetical protein